MRNNVKKKNLELPLSYNYVEDGPGYTGWLEDFPSIFAQGSNIEELERELIKILKYLIRIETTTKNK